MITLKNEYLTIAVNPMGAELFSVKSNADDHEYLWQGDPTVWNGRSPILFPIAGRLKSDSYRYQGKFYCLPKHGFARRNEIPVMEKTCPADGYTKREYMKELEKLVNN